MDYLALEASLDQYQRLYYAADPDEYAAKHDLTPISDLEYDQLVTRLTHYYSLHPDQQPTDSILNRVAVLDANTLAKVTHEVPMLSLPKAMNLDELYGWFDIMRIQGVTQLCSDEKVDGFAVELCYVNGLLTQVVTRGSGTEGEDITASVAMQASIPTVLSLTGTLRVRGECYMLNDVLPTVNTRRIQRNKEPYKNVRNGISGCLRNKDSSWLVGDEAHFKAYGLIHEGLGAQGEALIDFPAAMSFLRHHGFETVETVSWDLIHPSFLANLGTWITVWEAKRSALGYDIDGLVFRAALFNDQQRLGVSRTVPNWSIAYKFTAVEKETAVLDVIMTYGDKGNITPVAILEPVDLMGATISRCTLHNLDEVETLGIEIGDVVLIHRGGDVIPKITKVVRHTPNSRTIVFPKQCPSCQAPTQRQGPFLRCSNSNCSSLQLGLLNAFVQTLDIEDLGTSTLAQLVDQGYVRTPADLFRLTTADFQQLERIGLKTATKLVDRITAAKQRSLGIVIAALGIPKISISRGEQLAQRYPSLDALLHATVAELQALEGFGPELANGITTWCNQPTNQAFVLDLKSQGVGQLPTPNSTGPLTGKSFCFTGTLSRPRGYYESLVKQHGGQLSSVKKGLSYLVVGTDAGSKLSKATQLQITILDETAFTALLP